MNYIVDRPVSFNEPYFIVQSYDTYTAKDMNEVSASSSSTMTSTICGDTLRLFLWLHTCVENTESWRPGRQEPLPVGPFRLRGVSDRVQDALSEGLVLP